MKNVYLILAVLLFAMASAVPTPAAGAADPPVKESLGREVATIKLGFGDYILGRVLTDKQKDLARQHPVAKALAGTYKFQDGELFVVADEKSDMVIGIYKQNGEASREEVKKMVGELMVQFNEPTTMAHDKLIYWAFGRKGRISEEQFNQARQSGGRQVLATVKFSSSLPVFQEAAAAEGDQTEVAEIEQKAAIYVIISSNPLSNLYLAQGNE